MTVSDMVRYIGGGEFDHTSPDEIKFWDDFVTPMLSKKRLGKLYDQAKDLLICHKLALNGKAENGLGSLGQVKNSYTATSISDGGTSISFASVGAGNLAANAEYGMTAYGTQYLQLLRMAIVPIMCSGEDDIHVCP